MSENNYNDNLHKGANGKLYQYGRELRKSATNAEKILWECLRNRKCNGLKFRRQHPLDAFIVDFYCHEKKLVIEIDGAVHAGKMNKLYDKARTERLSSLGLKVIRFWNSQVEQNIESVLNEIKMICND